MITQLKDLPKESLATWHTCDACDKRYNFWDHPLEFDKIKDWWTDTSQHGAEYCDKCYPKEIKKNRKCKKCGEINIFMLREGDKNEEDGSCVKCIDKKIKILLDEERKKTDKQDARMKKNGSRYKAEIWVHPRQGGDDYRVDFYFREKPSKDRVQKIASHEGSAILTDFTIIKL